MQSLDTDFAKNTASQSKTITVGNTAIQILGNVPHRIGVVLSSPTANRVSVGPNPNIVDLEGIVLYATAFPFFVSIDQFPGLVNQALYAISNTGSNAIGIVEVFQV
jgi:hypothetical protein